MAGRADYLKQVEDEVVWMWRVRGRSMPFHGLVGECKRECVITGLHDYCFLRQGGFGVLWTHISAPRGEGKDNHVFRK